MRSEILAAAYGFERGADFEATFSKASLEGVLTYIVAAAIWSLETLLDLHRAEVDRRLDELLPHRAKWYRDKALAFMLDRQPIPDTDRYDTTGMTDEQIATARVVRHAVAVESGNASLLTIKVAGESGGVRAPLLEQTAVQLLAYLQEVKDAGVRLELVNEAPDLFNCEIDVYYNALLAPDLVRDGCRKAIEGYIANLPFNGEYTNMALVDALQAVEGVRIVELRSATTSNATTPATQSIDARYTPLAGYFTPGVITLNMKV
jgi:hypothetical protein